VETSKPPSTPHHEAAPKSTPEVTQESKPASQSNQEKKTEETHPAATPHKPEGGVKEGAGHPKGSPSAEKKE
jgi:hypothetical protein